LQAFDYHRPRSLSEALELKRSSMDAQWLAGGMTLLPAMKLRLAAPRRLIDLAGLDECSAAWRRMGSWRARVRFSIRFRR
jgi:carbon-monoxide dehydrogenase medium subunit